LVKGAEGCDDGAKVATDGCSATCTVETGWQCAGVPSSCAAICGDGQALGAETCDDDNQTAGDGCNATCQIEDGWDCMNRPSGCAAVCGDGKALGDEGCDDGNTQDGDGCTSTCQAEAVADVPTETKGGCSVGHARGAGGYRGTAACALLALAMMRRRRR
jgi:cysteine-rich repeat protein